MAVQMTREEYKKKYGAIPATSTVNTTPAVRKMKRAEYELQYGVPQDAQTSGGLSVFGSPSQTIKNTGEDVYNAISGQGQYQGQGAVRRGFSAAASAAMAVPSVAADVIPGGKAVLGAVSKGFEGATNFAGNIGSHLADAAQAVGVMSPEQRKQYDKNNAAFANSPLGLAIESGASVLKSSGDIANVILMAHGTAQATENFLAKAAPSIKTPIHNVNDIKNVASATGKELVAAGEKIVEQYQANVRTARVQDQANEIAAVESRYAKGRKLNKYSTEEGAPSRQRIADTDVLKNSVDESGTVRTTQPGGAVEKYKAMTTKPAEGVVRAHLEMEGNKVNLSDVRQALRQRVTSSGLKGADLNSALNGIDREVAGLRLEADDLGYVDTTLLHDAKVNQYNNINYQTPPETATYRKAVANGYKTLVENNSAYDIRGMNAELAKYYEDITRLEQLDGMKVQGGRLGKYTAQITGSIAGGAAGAIVGGPVGAAMGTVVGGEVGGLVKGKLMSSTFNQSIEGKAPSSPILDEAMARVQSSGALNRSQTYSTQNASAAPQDITPTIPQTQVPLSKITDSNTGESLADIKSRATLIKNRLLRNPETATHNALGRAVTEPIELLQNEDGTFTILDGNHRVTQAIINGDAKIPAIIKIEIAGKPIDINFIHSSEGTAFFKSLSKADQARVAEFDYTQSRALMPTTGGKMKSIDMSQPPKAQGGSNTEIPKELQPLANEALKYKNAEEFVSAAKGGTMGMTRELAQETIFKGVPQTYEGITKALTDFWHKVTKK